MITVFTGTNDYARQSELRRVVNDFVAEYGDVTLERIDASEIEFGRLLESVSTQPFLSDRRMIIVSNLTGNKDLSNGVEQLLDSVSDSTDVIIDEGKFDKRASLYKTLKKRTEFKEFSDLDERELAHWLTKQAAEKGGELKLNDAVHLVSRTGANQLALSHELDKLIGSDPIVTRRAIDELVEPLPTGTIFQLMDAAFTGNHTRTLELYKSQRLQQVEPQAIMGLIAWQVHVLAVVGANEKKSPEEITRSSKLNPYVVRKTLQLIRTKSIADIKKLVGRAVELDARLKSEMIDADDAVQHFLLTI